MSQLNQNSSNQPILELLSSKNKGSHIKITYRKGSKKFECIISNFETATFKEITDDVLVYDTSDNVLDENSSKTSETKSIYSSSKGSSCSGISGVSSSDFIKIDGLSYHKDEPDDELIYFNDNELIEKTEKILNRARNFGIDDYYKKNKIVYRQFTLSGLYSKKNGIKSDKQRYGIRELNRICQKFLESDYAKEESKRQVKIINKKQEVLNNEKLALEQEEIDRKKEEERINYELIDYDNICTRINKKGIRCNNFCVKRLIFCRECSTKPSKLNF